MASFRETYPIDFDLYDKDVQNVLYIEDTSDQTLTLEITNSSTQTINLENLANDVSSSNYHFALRFRPGTLSAASLGETTPSDPIQLDATTSLSWEMAGPETDDNDMDVIYLKSTTTDFSMDSEDKETIVFEKVGADAGQGARGTRVELLYQNMAFSNTPDDELSSNREIHLSVINHRGKQNIPLHVGFVGDNGVLNDGTTENELTLRFSNTLVYDASNPEQSELTFLYDADATVRSRIILSFDVGADISEEWALDDFDNVKNITITQPTGWVIEEDESGVTPEWTLYPETEDQVLYGINEPNDNAEYFDLEITGIISGFPTGHTHLHIQYEDIPGYWDGQLKVVIEKRPLIYYEDANGNRNVGIGTDEPPNKLTVYDGELSLKTDDNTKDQGLVFQNDGGWYTWRMYRTDAGNNYANLKFATGADADFANLTDIMTLEYDGNVGIGTDDPSEKLEVDGNIKASGNLETDGVLQVNGTGDSYLMGNVGIGTNTPSDTLHVSPSGKIAVLRLAPQDWSNTSITVLRFGPNDDFYIAGQQGGDMFINAPSDVFFNIGGNVGIGNVSDLEASLEVAANGTAETVLLGRTNNYASIKASTDGTGHLMIDSESDKYVSLNHYVSDDVVLAYGGGNVGIGTYNPSEARLVIGNGTNEDLLVFNTQRSWRFTTSDSGASTKLLLQSDVNGKQFQVTSPSGTAALVVNTSDSSGSVGINTTTINATLSVNGTASKTDGGSWSNFSDRRIKQDINPFTDSLEALKKVNPVRYRYNGKAGIEDSDTEQVGIIAQEIQEVFPYMVSTYNARLNETDEEDTELLSFNGGAMSFVLVNAVKELDAHLEKANAIIAKQQERITGQEKQIEALLTRIEALEAKLG